MLTIILGLFLIIVFGFLLYYFMDFDFERHGIGEGIAVLITVLFFLIYISICLFIIFKVEANRAVVNESKIEANIKTDNYFETKEFTIKSVDVDELFDELIVSIVFKDESGKYHKRRVTTVDNETNGKDAYIQYSIEKGILLDKVLIKLFISDEEIMKYVSKEN